MKSAYELAMERLQKQAPATTVTGDQKAALAEIDSSTKAKIAERELFLLDQIRKTTEPTEETALRDQLAREIRRIQQDSEDKKEKVRNGTA